MAVQQETNKKSILGTAQAAFDDVFTRVTAGISPSDFRSMIRGEPPGRPNPRLKPHSETFLLHIKPTYYHESVTRFTHTFRLGLLSTYIFFVEVITGLILMIWYAPSPERAYPAAEQCPLRPVYARSAPAGRGDHGRGGHITYGQNLLDGEL